jgi:hypothetical protein
VDEQEQRVAEHLRTLSICHYVYAGLASVGCGAAGLMYVALGSFAGHMMKAIPQNDSAHPPPPPEIASMFTWIFSAFGAAFVLAGLTVGLLCFLSARAMAQHRNRTLSLVVAALVCVTGMLGIVLGVFTFIVLLKPEAERLYAGSPPAA